MTDGAAGGAGGARVFAVLGDPVAHSLSPHMHTAAFTALGLDGVYVAVRCTPDDVGPMMRSLAAAGGGGNLTLPLKERGVAALDHATPAVLRTGACNTFWRDTEGRLCGDNTDVVGFRRALAALLGDADAPAPAAGLDVLVLGAGGAARAAVTALLDDGAARVVVSNRTPQRAAALVAGFADPRLVPIGPLTPDAAGAYAGPFHLVVNATRLGLDDADPLPIAPAALAGAGSLFDLVYARHSPQGTRLVREARALGLRAADGAEMLVQQGAAALEHWWPVRAPVDVMRRAIEDARMG